MKLEQVTEMVVGEFESKISGRIVDWSSECRRGIPGFFFDFIVTAGLI